MNKIINIQPFYKSILSGIIVWAIILIIVPAKGAFPFLTKSVLFIFLNLTIFIFGYAIIPLKKKCLNYKPEAKTIYFIFSFFLIIYLIRYYDIFVLRQASINLPTQLNRQLLKDGLQFNNLITTFATLFKALYFLPLVFYFYSNKKNRLFYIFSLLFFILPFPEALVRGSRNQFFESIIIMFFIHLFFKKIKMNYRTVFIIFFLGIFLLFVSSKMLHKREGVKRTDFNELVSKKVIYNQLLVPEPWIYEKIIKINNEKLRQVAISTVQIGQYYSHSVYEFNYVMANYKEGFQKGKYNFNTLCKFTNHYKLSNFNLEKIAASPPRKITYITLFGGMYIDFGWFSLVVFFILGILQKLVYNRINNGFSGVIFTTLTIFFLYSNFFLLTVNFYNSMGLYTIFSLLALLVSYNLFTFVKSKIQ